MARWQIKGLLLLGAALAGLTLAASASAAAGTPPQAEADRPSCAMITGGGDAAYQPAMLLRRHEVDAAG
jgi:hypothetical protein